MMLGTEPPQGSEFRWAVVLALLGLFVATGLSVPALQYALQFAAKPSLAAARAGRDAVAQWPQTPARLVRLTLAKESTGRGSGAHYLPQVSYRYDVGAGSYMGDRLTLDESWRVVFGASNAGDFRVRVRALAPGIDLAQFFDAPQCAELESYGSCSVTFELDQSIVVHYDPAKPWNSTIESRDIVPVSVLDYLVSPLMWIASLLLFVYVSGTSAWRLFLWLLRRFDNTRRAAPPVPLMRLWQIAVGFNMLCICVEFYNINLGWRGAANDGEENLAWLMMILIFIQLGPLGLYMMFKPAIDKRFRVGRHQRKRRWTWQWWR